MEKAWLVLKLETVISAPPEHEGRLGVYESQYPVPETRPEPRIYLNQIASESGADDEQRLTDWINYASTHENIHREIDPELYQWLIPRLSQMDEGQRKRAAEYPAIMSALAGLPEEEQQLILGRARGR